MQVHKPSEAGEWHLEHTPCIEVLVRNKAAILDALTDAKYDKITHVRQAVGKALVEMDCIPSPKSRSTIASMLSEEGPDLETLLASKRTEPNNRPWSGTSTELEMAGLSRSGSRGAEYALEEAGQADHHAPSPKLDMGTSFEPDQITGYSPTGTGRRNGPEQALPSRQGSRREWAGKASCSVNRYNWISVCTHCTAHGMLHSRPSTIAIYILTLQMLCGLASRCRLCNKHNITLECLKPYLMEPRVMSL